MPDELSRRKALQLLAGSAVGSNAGPVLGGAVLGGSVLGGSVIGVAGCAKPGANREPSKQVQRTSTHKSAGADKSGSSVSSVKRLGNVGSWPTPDPFLFCVHHNDQYPAGNSQFGPATSLDGRNLGQDFARKDGWNMYHGRIVPGFPAHPHRGFETVTVVRRGLLDHSDSLGAAARYGQGDVQWLTAGAGIQHAEMFPLLDSEKPNPLELFQIWLNLPRKNKMVAPHFSMLWADTIPTVPVKGRGGKTTRITLRAGRWEDVGAPPPPPNSWAADPDNHIGIWTVQLPPGASWDLPPAPPGVERSIYFFRGAAMEVGGQSVVVKHQINPTVGRELRFTNGPQEAELLVLQGRAINEPIARRGPFVMNTQEEIREAYADYRSTRFGGWPWEGSDPVHGDRPERFAKRVDGRVERPG